jgi:hypothetical protein
MIRPSYAEIIVGDGAYRLRLANAQGAGDRRNMTVVGYVSDKYGASTRVSFGIKCVRFHSSHMCHAPRDHSNRTSAFHPSVYPVVVSLSTLVSNVTSLLSSAAATSNLDSILQVGDQWLDNVT